MQNITVSLLENIRSKTVIGEVTIENWLTSNQYKEQVLQYRAATAKRERRKLLLELPAVTPRTTYVDSVYGEAKEHNTLCLMKVHHPNYVGEHGLGSMKRQLISSIPEILYCGLAVSGKSLDVLIRVDTPDYDDEFCSIELQFQIAMPGIVVRHCNGDIMVASYDPERYINFDASSVIFGYDLHQERKRCQTRVLRMLEQIKQTRSPLTDGHVHDMGLEIAYAFGAEGKGLFDDFMNRDRDEEYDWHELYAFRMQFFGSILKKAS